MKFYKFLVVFLFFLVNNSSIYKYDLNIITLIDPENTITINYPQTNIQKIDNVIKRFIDEEYYFYLNNLLNPIELNLDYNIEINKDFHNITLTSNINDFTKTKTIGFKQKNIFKKQKKSFSKQTVSKKSSKVIALTFDDGPSKYTNDILELLNKYNAKATFFVLGNKVNMYTDTLKNIINQGSEIGNHTYNHKLLTRLTSDSIKEQIDKTNDLIYSETNYKPTIFRPSYGSYNTKIKNSTDLDIILWNVDSLDWKLKNPKAIFKRVTRTAKDNSIILMHDTYKRSLIATEMILEHYINEGYSFITISELRKEKAMKES